MCVISGVPGAVFEPPGRSCQARDETDAAGHPSPPRDKALKILGSELGRTSSLVPGLAPNFLAG